MQYELIIEHFDPEIRGFKIGTVDVTLKYNSEKQETFRNIGIFQKENKRWVSMPKIKRLQTSDEGADKELWLPVYERTPPLTKEIFTEILNEVQENYLTK